MDMEKSEAYRAEICKLIYPSLKVYIDNRDIARITELLENLNLNVNHDDFPVISALYNNPLSSKITINNTTLELIDADLIRDLSGLNLDNQSLKTIILQEIIFMSRLNLNEADKDLKEVRMKRNEINGVTALFWDSVHYDIDDLNEKLKNGDLSVKDDFQMFFQMVETIIRGGLGNNLVTQNFGCFWLLFERDRTNQRHNFIKVIKELELSDKISAYLSKQKIDGKNVLSFLIKNGLSEKILKSYRIHPTELSARLHLKLLKENIIKEDYECESERQRCDLKVRLRDEHQRNAQEKATQLSNNKVLLVDATPQQTKYYRVDHVYERDEAVKALKEFVERSGIIDLNKYLVDLWLIEYCKLSNYDEIVKCRNDFMSGKPISGFLFEKFEGENHFLDSTVAKSLRKEKDVKYLIHRITENKDRQKVLSEFLEKNKTQFASYGSNLFIYESDAILSTAEKLYTKLKLYKNLGSHPCHKIIIDAFKSFKILLHIRYSDKNKAHDGIGHFGGFAREIKRVQLKNENGVFVYKNPVEIKDHFTNILSREDALVNFELKYDGALVTFNSKEELADYLKDFNDVLYKANRLFLVVNDLTIKKNTAIIAANKKFNNLCKENKKDILKRIIENATSQINEEYLIENNGTINKAGTTGSLNADKLKYDISTVFSLGVSSGDYEELCSQNENQNKVLKDVTTSEALSLFDLIQRFGFFGETGSEIKLINNHDDYSSYAYKYIHEYFAGVISTITKILDILENKFREEFRANNDECKNLRFWILGHLFAAAQNSVLDGENSSLTKQIIECTNGSRRFIQTRKPAKHVINLKKYIHQNIGENQSGSLDDEQMKYMQKFFGETVTDEDFSKIQEIISGVHVSVTLKNLVNSFLDSGRLSLSQSDTVTAVIPTFKEATTTVYKNLEYEIDNGDLSLALFGIYNNVRSIKKILEQVLGQAPVIVAYNSSVIVSKPHLKEKLKEFILQAIIETAENVKKIRVICKPEIRMLLIELMQKSNIKAELNNDDVLIEHSIRGNQNYLKDILYQILNNHEPNVTNGFINFLEMIIDNFESNIYLQRIKLDSTTTTALRYALKPVQQEDMEIN